MKKKLLWVGDAGCPTGFARATHEILARLCVEYDVTVLAINYRGDPHSYPYDLYAAGAGGDALGVARLPWMCHRVQPDVIVVQQDGWFMPYYVRALRAKKANGEYEYPDFAGIPIIAAVAVDGKNFRGDWLKGIAHTIFWTNFALDEARRGSYLGPASVIPLGVDQSVYYPVDRNEALTRMKVGVLKDKFIVGSVNRNQSRKRWDLTLRYFAQWVKSYKVLDAQLFMHAAPTGDDGVDVEQLAKYYGIIHQIGFREPEMFYGLSEAGMRDTYNMFDVSISTTQGEGMGLTTMEAMACGVPCIVPEWSALGDWAKGAVSLVPCTSTAINNVSPGLNVLGGVADERAFVEALDRLYRDKHLRNEVGNLGLARVSEDRFRWEHISAGWYEVLEGVLEPASAQPVAASLSQPGQALGEAPAQEESLATPVPSSVAGPAPASLSPASASFAPGGRKG